MKSLKVVFFIVAVFMAGSAYALNADSVIGEWYNAEGTSLINIHKCEAFYCGKIVWLKNPKDENGNEKVDSKNPDETKRSQKLMGLPILWGFTYSGGNRWEDGKIYDPKKGKTYSCKMTLEGNQLNIRGFIGVSLLGRTTVWTRKQ
jgi:uncharacterized protein (DUF2147 family)